MENISKTTEYACSGCGACVAVCPKAAIRLELDAAGFLCAKVDDARCVNCGLCKSVCARFDAELDGVDLRTAKLYAVQSADPETVRRCSSGGLAHELALEAVRTGARVLGAVYDLQTNRVRHALVASAAEVARLDGSKYLQSDPQQAFQEALSLAKADPAARFAVFGTPCQIAGLDKACKLLNMRDRFFLVEIFCHGVPSDKLWETQLAKLKRKLKTERFDSVLFRYKKDDWHSYCLRADANRKTFYGARERELFWQVFFENVLLGDACMTCRLRKETSRADLRIGDYWGRRYQHRSDGVSAAFACTERGRTAMEQLLSDGKLLALEPGTPEEMLLTQNMAGYCEKALHESCMQQLREGTDFCTVVRYYRANEPRKKKIKRFLLRCSAVIPDGFRAKLRKIDSRR